MKQTKHQVNLNQVKPLEKIDINKDMKFIEVGDYTIIDKLPYDGRKKNTIWISNKTGEGMQVNLDKLWKEAF